ncbi:54S ribosomal protein L23, mitochondrial [Desmophyllum pertusum]|uniref:Large ribosomal subunit protein uL23m n=1 Tax=Desmophyllum pertusum TaxID=174260 RepID=A0A9W9YAN8_9CNID|nr:54S ribosomal protein L23, mitochondrial [Desmophyllum pertusum]
MAYRHVVRNPRLQARIFLCNWYMKVVRPGKELPDNVVQFHVPMDMSKLDVKNYLTSIYKLDIANVNTRIQHGKTKSIVKGDQLIKRKYPDYKVAYVTLATGTFKFPDLIPAKPDVKDEESAQSDTTSQASASLRWF